jgi:hypothetical protein
MGIKKRDFKDEDSVEADLDFLHLLPVLKLLILVSGSLLPYCSIT